MSYELLGSFMRCFGTKMTLVCGSATTLLTKRAISPDLDSV